MTLPDKKTQPLLILHSRGRLAPKDSEQMESEFKSKTGIDTLILDSLFDYAAIIGDASTILFKG